MGSWKTPSGQDSLIPPWWRKLTVLEVYRQINCEWYEQWRTRALHIHLSAYSAKHVSLTKSNDFAFSSSCKNICFRANIISLHIFAIMPNNVTWSFIVWVLPMRVLRQEVYTWQAAYKPWYSILVNCISRKEIAVSNKKRQDTGSSSTQDPIQKLFAWSLAFEAHTCFQGAQLQLDRATATWCFKIVRLVESEI